MTGGRNIALLGVPIDCLGYGGKPFGTELSPDALRRAGLARALAAEDLGDVGLRIASPARDAKWGIVGHDDVLDVTRTLRRHVAGLAARDRKLLLLGGCCSLVPGALAGLRDALGPVGLAYIDGHSDLYDGQTSPTGEAADVPLATMLGHGPASLVKALGPGRCVAPYHAALLGFRDREEAERNGSLLPEDIGEGFRFVDREGAGHDPAGVGSETAARLAGDSGCFFVSIDWDVLEPGVFPATDYLQPGGMSWAELTALARPLLSSPACVGLAMTCYNPEKDTAALDCGARIVDFLAGMFSPVS